MYVKTLAACFVVIKVLFSEVLNNQVTYNTQLNDISKVEKSYFFSLGMGLIALLVDYLFAVN